MGSPCEKHEAARSDRITSGGSTTSTSSRSTTSSSLGESPRTGSVDDESLPLCPNCQVRHPGGESKGHFCTEGKQGVLETLVAMGTLGLVSLRERFVYGEVERGEVEGETREDT